MNPYVLRTPINLLEKLPYNFPKLLRYRDRLDNIVENDKKGQLFSTIFFSNIITNLVIPQHIEGQPISQNIDHPLMQAIKRYRLHPSIIAIKMCLKCLL